MQTMLSTEHDQWHRENGKYTNCNLDCGASEIVGDAFEDDAEALQESGARGIRCGSCKGRHATVKMVRFCYEVKADAETAKRNEAAMVAFINESGECEHGLSQVFCAGPNHYPQDL